MNIRTLSPNEFLAPVAALHAACFEDAWSTQSIADLLSAAGTNGFAAEEGFVIIRRVGEEAEILTLAVRPSARGKGLGALLVQAAANGVQVEGATSVFLEVGALNAVARALYGKLGFIQVGLRKAYYHKSRLAPEDALILRSKLPLSPLGKSPSTG